MKVEDQSDRSTPLPIPRTGDNIQKETILSTHQGNTFINQTKQMPGINAGGVMRRPMLGNNIDLIDNLKGGVDNGNKPKSLLNANN